MKKSPVTKEVMKPVSKMEREARCQFEKEKMDYQACLKIESMLNKKAEKDAEKLVKAGDISGAQLLLADALDSIPAEPTPRRYIINDATVEKLGVIMENNHQGVLLYRDEMSGWLSGLARDDRQQDRAFYLEAWNGD